MQNIYVDSAKVEKEVKNRYKFPDFVMMENAAFALESETSFVYFTVSPKYSETKERKDILILCGGGNNGADGIALARRLEGSADIKVCLLNEIKTLEAKTQFEIAKSVGVKFVSKDELNILLNAKNPPSIIIDCIYGTGFHGSLSEEETALISKINSLDSYRIACDVPSGIDKHGKIETKFNGEKIAFNADKTVSMGAMKLSLLTDEAREFTGELLTASLGISFSKYNECEKPDAILLSGEDLCLPIRKHSSSNKSQFGHSAIILGEKTGAGILAGTAALKFGCGYSTCVKTDESYKIFDMNPSLLISDTLPENVSAVSVGSGLGRNKEKVSEILSRLIIPYCETEKPSIVFDADIFYAEEFPSMLEKLNENENARVILTPHPKELYVLLNALKIYKDGKKENELSDVISERFFYAKLFGERYKNIVLLSKGAVNYIVKGSETFIVANGTVSLAKAGMGDVLSGMCVSLLAQNCSALEAAKNACLSHATASNVKNNYSLSPLDLIDLVSNLDSRDFKDKRNIKI